VIASFIDYTLRKLFRCGSHCWLGCLSAQAQPRHDGAAGVPLHTADCHPKRADGHSVGHCQLACLQWVGLREMLLRLPTLGLTDPLPLWKGGYDGTSNYGVNELEGYMEKHIERRGRVAHYKAAKVGNLIQARLYMEMLPKKVNNYYQNSRPTNKTFPYSTINSIKKTSTPRKSGCLSTLARIQKFSTDLNSSQITHLEAHTVDTLVKVQNSRLFIDPASPRRPISSTAKRTTGPDGKHPSH